MATPNYSFEKRQRELAKKRKAEEKRQRKQVPPRPDEHVSPGGQSASGSNPAPNDPGAEPTT